MALQLVYSTTRRAPIIVDPLDVEAANLIGVDFTDWLIGAETVAAFDVVEESDGLLVIGDDIETLTNDAGVVTPPAPALSAKVLSAYVWAEQTAKDENLGKLATVKVTANTSAGRAAVVRLTMQLSER